jgi:hypothetical protein
MRLVELVMLSAASCAHQHIALEARIFGQLRITFVTRLTPSLTVGASTACCHTPILLQTAKHCVIILHAIQGPSLESGRMSTSWTSDFAVVSYFLQASIAKAMEALQKLGHFFSFESVLSHADKACKEIIIGLEHF